MSLRIEFDGVSDCNTMQNIETALRSHIGTSPNDEEWSVSIRSHGSFCVVLVKTAQQTRRKLFFLPAAELADAIPEWLDRYHLR